MIELSTLGIQNPYQEEINEEKQCEKSKMRLDLSRYNLFTLPSKIAELGITSLKLRHNRFEWPDGIAQWTTLTKLDLAYNSIQEIRSEIGTLTSLTSLNVSHNQLNSLPPSMRKLTRLVKMKANYNGFKAIPKEASSWHRLQIFYLRCNYISDFSMLSELPASSAIDLTPHSLFPFSAEDITLLENFSSSHVGPKIIWEKSLPEFEDFVWIP